jgi:hypothetical protein
MSKTMRVKPRFSSAASTSSYSLMLCLLLARLRTTVGSRGLFSPASGRP